MPMGHATIVAKTEPDPASLAPLLRDIVQQLDPDATLGRLGPLAVKISTSVSGSRFTAFVLVAFAALALALATTGLYGVLSYNVAQRRREIGVRAALGATRAHLVRMVLREGMTVTVIGLAVGVAVAAFATRAMASVLFGVTPLDRVAFSLGALLLLVVACAACLIPAGARQPSIPPRRCEPNEGGNSSGSSARAIYRMRRRSFPVVARLSRSRCARAAAANG
ncbi:MAG: FtsX-like permease family protein [Luteitalea sp.]|nr:FtsX-like permease family protein [Luteitalea sp.]